MSNNEEQPKYMNYLAGQLLPFYRALNEKVKNKDFVKNVTNKTTDIMGNNLVELIAPRIVFDMSKVDDDGIVFDGRKSPKKYLEKEKEWYLSEELKIDRVKSTEIWSRICDVNEEVCSNYGNLVFSKNNYSQYSHALNTLYKDPNSRQAIIIYTRPSIHLEYNDMGSSDFICTNFQHFFIRDMKLCCVTSMRSNDCIFGTFNDLPWFVYVARRMCEDLKKDERLQDLQLGEMTFIPNSFHCYERHFDLLAKIAD